MSDIKRFFVERKEDFREENQALLQSLHRDLGLASLSDVRIIRRYDLALDSGMDVAQICDLILSEPRVDTSYVENLPADYDGKTVLAVEPLPGQYDQRADSCAQCIEVVVGAKPVVKTALVYVLTGALSDAELEAIKHYLINPVESRQAMLEKPAAFEQPVAAPDTVPNVDGLIEADDAGIDAIIKQYGLSMDADDLRFLQAYFQKEQRNPTETELKVIDTYWSDHCRHTTFNTEITDVDIDDPMVAKVYEEYLALREDVYAGRENWPPISLMDLGTISTKYLKKHGLVRNLDESEEINACSVKTEVDIDGVKEPWIYMFKNETHNHPTEIEPYGGAATCLGGAIRDPLSGRSYVYQSMRVTGAADPHKSLEETLSGKLPQRKICTLAAKGFSAYGNQIGMATGLVDEVYHPGYEAKRMEVGAVVAAAPAENIVRERPTPGDIVVLLGGKTGRDGCGGATGSSKKHDIDSLETSGAEVQKGNPVEERKIQRLFRHPNIAKMIKRCNDFGAGGVSVAIGELADSLHIYLDRVPKKYEGLTGTELAISESQERMACVITKDNWETFRDTAYAENLECTVVAEVTDTGRMIIEYRGQHIVDLSRVFLDSAGAQKQARVHAVQDVAAEQTQEVSADKVEALKKHLSGLNVCSKAGLVEQFDSTIGAGTVLFPFGGRNQATPIQTMVAKLPVLRGETNTVSMFAYGFSPEAMAQNQFWGAYHSVLESLMKLIATGTKTTDVYLSMQEYFHSIKNEPSRWGQPFKALLGALAAQRDLEVPAIGGKDSMSGTFEDMDVPPTLISFATTISEADRVISPEFKAAGHKLVTVTVPRRADGRVDAEGFKQFYSAMQDAIAAGKVVAAWSVGQGGIVEGLYKMAIGNHLGVDFASDVDFAALFAPAVGTLILELAEDIDLDARVLGTVGEDFVFDFSGEKIALADLAEAYEKPLEEIYPTVADNDYQGMPELPETTLAPAYSFQGKIDGAPKAVLAVFPGTNCEYDTARVLERAGAKVQPV
ncbi:MAG: phosphoribosylformylglycinamidine synthase, partial [Peptococcaceae bacterium]|nr:phosphoribosylformylglycinamidine synthase [Peptococcaceae bacterium]